MKEEIRKFKERHKNMKELEIVLRKISGLPDEKNIKQTEAIKMLDLRTEILYGEGYINAFMNGLRENTYEKESKYNVKRVNEHLLKIIEEYKQMTEELDAIIFADEEVG